MHWQGFESTDAQEKMVVDTVHISWDKREKAQEKAADDTQALWDVQDKKDAEYWRASWDAVEKIFAGTKLAGSDAQKKWDAELAATQAMVDDIKRQAEESAKERADADAARENDMIDLDARLTRMSKDIETLEDSHTRRTKDIKALEASQKVSAKEIADGCAAMTAGIANVAGMVERVRSRVRDLENWVAFRVSFVCFRGSVCAD